MCSQDTSCPTDHMPRPGQPEAGIGSKLHTRTPQRATSKDIYGTLSGPTITVYTGTKSVKQAWLMFGRPSGGMADHVCAQCHAASALRKDSGAHRADILWPRARNKGAISLAFKWCFATNSSFVTLSWTTPLCSRTPLSMQARVRDTLLDTKVLLLLDTGTIR